MLGVLALIIAGYSLAFGFVLEKIIVSGLKQPNPVQFLNSLLLYFFIAGFVVRYFMQSLPVLDTQPYLHLPIARSRIVHFMLGRSLVHIANIFIFLIFTPFAFSAVAHAYGFLQAWVWLVSLWLVSLVNHFLVTLFKKKLDDNVWGLLIFLLIYGALAAADYFGWFKLSAVSEMAFNTTLRSYTGIGLLLMMVAALYGISHRFFLNGLYPEEISVQQGNNFRSANWAFLQNFGLTGEWISIELKLIFRSKRTRTILFMNVLFLFYGVIFFRNPQAGHAMGLIIFLGTFITGIFMINYGQFLFSWQASHFDFTLTRPVSIRQFVESKYWLLTSVTAIWFILSIPYAAYDWNFPMVFFACALFNVGINSFVIMNMALWSPKKIDLTRGGAFNTEGVGAAQWLMSIPILAGPFVFYLPFSLMGYPIAGIVAIGAAGLTGTVFRNKLIDFTARRLSGMRYRIAANFRKE
jgi:hypothetical protein